MKGALMSTTKHETSEATQGNKRRFKNPNFTGPSLETVLSSSTARSKGIPHLMEYEYLRGEVLNSKQKFTYHFFSDLERMRNKIDPSWVEGCKVRNKELSDILAKIISSDPNLDLVFITLNRGKQRKQVYNIEDIVYCGGKFSIVGIGEDEEVVDIFISNSRPNFYGHLFVAMVKVALACRDQKYLDEHLHVQLTDLAMSILEIGGLFNETNPDPFEWKKQELETLSILTNPPKPENDNEVSFHFEKVINDVKDGKKPYVRELSDAIKSTRRYVQSPFNDSDYYFSNKADSAYIPGFKFKQSLVKSMLETDPLKGCSFDNAVGYISAYNEVRPKGYKDPWLTTIHIPNPGKYKTRAIHLALSAIQDRCCYIHNRIAAVLSKIPSDCTKDQSRGHLFTRQITNPSYRENRGWSSVLAYDWSNATDKLRQSFQERCLELLFDKPEVIEFWHTVSTCDKVFIHKDGSRTPYKQENGQPQGLLGSFDAFAFAHHIMMLITMSLAGLEDKLASEFYRVLGDDSIISSIKWDPNNVVGDSYCRVCSWANVEVNRSKSTEILDKDKVALVDFAKVTVLDGRHFSPIPARLSNRIGKTNQDYFAFSSALWQGNNGFFKPEWFMGLVDFYYPDELDNKLAKQSIMSGILPAFKAVGFDDPFLAKETLSLALAVCYAYQEISTSFLLTLIGDKVKDNLDILDKETDIDSLSCLLPPSLEGIWDKVENIDHKINIALENNLSQETTIKSILSCSEDQAKLFCATAQINEEEFRLITKTVNLVESMLLEPKNLNYFSQEIIDLRGNLSLLDRLQFRSLYKRNALDAVVLRRSIKMFKSLFTVTDEGLVIASKPGKEIPA